MIKVKFIHAHAFKTPAMNVIASKWHGKMILIAQPVAPRHWHQCQSDVIWRIAELEMINDIIDAGGSPLPCICRHMFEGSD